MQVFQGNTSTTATSTAANVNLYIGSFSLCNKSGGSITVSAGILYGSTFYVVYNKSLAAGESYIYTGGKILLKANYQVYVSVSGSCDYIFTFE